MPLVLTRKQGESVWIGQCKVTIARVERRGAGPWHVKLVFDGPPDVGIWRDEVIDRIYEEAVEPTPIRKGVAS